MPEESFEEKTEQPTPKKIRESREKGSVAKSTELNSAAILILGLSFLYFTGGSTWMSIMDATKVVYNQIGQVDASINNAGVYFKIGAEFVGTLLAPFLFFVLFIGVGINLLQIGFLFTTKPLEPDLTKLNPLSGVKNLVSLKGLMEGAKGFFKVGVVFTATYLVLKADIDEIFGIADCTVGQILIFITTKMFKLGMIVALILLAMALLDYAFQRWNHLRQLKMTKQEVKEERKQMEGDPQVKSRIKSLMREMARRRMMEEVPKATVVVTNPTFIAIALRYDAETMNTPTVVAKGKRVIAEKIKEIARENGVPIVEDKPLARSMYDVVEIGDEIPPDFFPAVAEILAYVYKLQKKVA